MEAYLDGKEPDEATLKRLHPQGHGHRHVRAGAVRRGVQEQGRAAAARRGRRLPAVADSTSPPVKGIEAGHRRAEVVRKRSDDEPFAGLAFKIMNDPFVGTLTFVRIYSGMLETRHVDPEHGQGRARAHRPHAADARQQPRGDQGGARRRHRRPAGLKDTTTGDTLCDPAKPIVLERMEFPEPVIEVAVEPKTKGDQEKMGVALSRLAHGGSRRSASASDHESGQTIIKGMGELHLEIIVDRMKREFKVEANVGAPQVAYRETITQTRRARLHAQEADRRLRPVRRVKIRFEPLRAGQRLRVRERGRRRLGAAGISSRASRRASNGAPKTGVLAGFPMIDFKASLIDGAYHDVDSTCWRSRSRRAPASARAWPRPGRSCSSRSCGSRW